MNFVPNTPQRIALAAIAGIVAVVQTALIFTDGPRGSWYFVYLVSAGLIFLALHGSEFTPRAKPPTSTPLSGPRAEAMQKRVDSLVDLLEEASTRLYHVIEKHRLQPSQAKITARQPAMLLAYALVRASFELHGLNSTRLFYFSAITSILTSETIQALPSSATIRDPELLKAQVNDPKVRAAARPLLESYEEAGAQVGANLRAQTDRPFEPLYTHLRGFLGPQADLEHVHQVFSETLRATFQALHQGTLAS